MIANSEFSHFLAAAITTESVQFLIEKVYVYTRQEFLLQPLSIWNCQFRDFRVFENGGAFAANHDVELSNVLFRNSTALKGGCFFAKSAVSCVYCSFLESQGKLGGGFAAVGEKEPVVIKECVFSQLEATRSAGFHALGSVCVESTNFTRTTSESETGAFETNGSIEVEFSRFVYTGARTENGAIVLRDSGRVTIKDAFFGHCSHRTSVENAGAAVFAQNVTGGSEITHCHFVDSRRGAGHTIAIVIGGPIHIRSCCFSDAKDAEIWAKDAVVSHAKCSFQGECPSDEMPYPADIGFRKGRSPTYTAVGSYLAIQPDPPKRKLFSHGVQVLLVILGFTGALLLQYFVEAVIQAVITRPTLKGTRGVL
jgi:hypothetical protein